MMKMDCKGCGSIESALAPLEEVAAAEGGVEVFEATVVVPGAARAAEQKLSNSRSEKPKAKSDWLEVAGCRLQVAGYSVQVESLQPATCNLQLATLSDGWKGS